MKKERTAAVPARDDELLTRQEDEHASLRAQLLRWYAQGKRDLPWRRTSDPFAVWVSEVMLQQTRVETVVPYYERFLARFPTVHALAEAPLDDVLARWSGLGYYRRARALHEAARDVARTHGGKLPDTVEGLRAIRGIGPYTAGAVASIAFGRRAAAVDGNVARVIARLFAIDDDVRKPTGLARVRELADALVPDDDAGAWNQALMELGATVCVPRAPRCLLCPARDACRAHATGRQNELPVLAPKRAPIPWERDALVAVRGGEVLFARRRGDRLFGGMWEPPLVDRADPAGLTSVVALAPKAAAAFAEVGRTEHVLSHRHLRLRVFRVELPRRARPPRLLRTDEYDEVAFLDAAGLAARGASTLCRKILAAADAPL